MLLPKKCCKKCIHSHSAEGFVMYVECRNKDHIKEEGVPQQKSVLETCSYRCKYYEGRQR
jgi:hypothetical protein